MSERVAMGTGDRSDHFVPLVAYSTGLILGRFLVDIVADLVGPHSREGNGVSTVDSDVSPLPMRQPESEEEYAERIRNAIRRGIKAAEEGRVWTHEDAMRRLAPWLGD